MRSGRAAWERWAAGAALGLALGCSSGPSAPPSPVPSPPARASLPDPGQGGIHDFGGAPDRVPPALEPLQQALDGGRLEEAARLLGELGGVHGQDPDFLALSGRLLHLQGRFREAAEAYGRALAARPDDLSLVFRAFETEMYRDPRQAARIVAGALRRHPRSAALHLCRAEALILSAVAWEAVGAELERLAGEAEVEARRARKLGGLVRDDGSQTGDVEAVLGEVAMLRGDLAGARGHFARALDLGIDNPDRGIDVANALGFVAYRTGDREAARRAWRTGAEIWQGWDRLSFFRLTSKGEGLLYYGEVFGGGPPVAEKDLDWMYAREADLLGRGFAAEERYRRVRDWNYDFVRARARGDLATALDRRLHLKGSGPVDRPRPGEDDILCFYFYKVDAPLSVACDSVLAGDLLWRLGRREEARAQYREALAALPGDPLVEARLRSGP